jgi:hypothetical protein
MRSGTLNAALAICLVGAAAENSVLRVPLHKRQLDIDQVKASKASLQQCNTLQRLKGLLGEAEEADIPLLDFLDAQCKHPFDSQQCRWDFWKFSQ